MARLLRRPKPAAGRFAEDHYKKLYEPWKRAIRPRALVGVALVWLLALVWILLFPRISDFMLGVAAGGSVVLYMTLLDSPPEWIERWRRGSTGEKRTAKQLGRLNTESWSAAHGLRAMFGDFDHVVIGPAGVFLLETKEWTGRCSIEESVPVVRRGDDEIDSWAAHKLPGQVRARAAELRSLLQTHGRVGWVQGVVVLWCEFDARVFETDKLAYVAGDHLVQWLLDQPARLDEATRTALAQTVQHLATVGSSAPVVAAGGAPA